MNTTAELALVVGAMSAVTVFVFGLLRRAERVPPRLDLALRLARHEAALRGQRAWGDAFLLYALLHDPQATRGVVDDQTRASWQAVTHAFLSSLPRDQPGRRTTRTLSPPIEDRLRRATGSPGVDLPSLVREIIAQPELAALRAKLQRAPSRQGASQGYRDGGLPGGAFQVRLWDDGRLSAKDVEALLDEVAGIRGTQASFHWLEMQLLGSTTIGPLEEAKTQLVMEAARETARREGRRVRLAVEPAPKPR